MQDDFDVFAEQYIKSYRQRYGHASELRLCALSDAKIIRV